MDVISVASSVTGLLLAAGKVIGFLCTMVDAPSTARDVLAEVHALQAVFRQLDGFISAPNQQSTAQKSRIQLHDFVVTLADCVSTFSKLDVQLKELGAADSQGTDPVTLTTREKARWAMKDKDIAGILRQLQMHKASLGLMLSIYSWFVCRLGLPASTQSLTKYVQRVSTTSTMRNYQVEGAHHRAFAVESRFCRT